MRPRLIIRSYQTVGSPASLQNLHLEASQDRVAQQTYVDECFGKKHFRKHEIALAANAKSVTSVFCSPCRVRASLRRLHRNLSACRVRSRICKNI